MVLGDFYENVVGWFLVLEGAEVSDYRVVVVSVDFGGD